MLVKPCSTVRLVASGRLDAVGVEHDVVEEVLDCQHTPLVRVNAFCAQSNLGSRPKELVREAEIELRVTGLVEHSETPRLRHFGVGANRQKRLCMVTAICFDHACRAHVQRAAAMCAGRASPKTPARSAPR
jgi:hypothetical protein